jgi:hypothetical protein
MEKEQRAERLKQLRAAREAKSGGSPSTSSNGSFDADYKNSVSPALTISSPNSQNTPKQLLPSFSLPLDKIGTINTYILPNYLGRSSSKTVNMTENMGRIPNITVDRRNVVEIIKITTIQRFIFLHYSGRSYRGFKRPQKFLIFLIYPRYVLTN